MWIALATAAALAALPACGRQPARAAIVVPVRAATAGDPLLAVAPAGADAVLELDLARLRGNPTIGRLARALLPRGDDRAPGILALDAVVIASYGIGQGAPRTLLLGRGGAAARLPAAELIGRGIHAMGDAALVRRSQATYFGHEPSLLSDRELGALRAAAMPAGARSATLRLTARLSFDGRLALARRLEVDAVPRTISLWGDAVDDVAVVALLGADRAADTAGLERAGHSLVMRLARAAPLVGRRLARELGRTRLEATRGQVRFTLVIGPRRLARLVDGALETLNKGSGSTRSTEGT